MDLGDYSDPWIARNRIGLTYGCAAINLRRLIHLGVDCNNGWRPAT